MWKLGLKTNQGMWVRIPHRERASGRIYKVIKGQAPANDTTNRDFGREGPVTSPRRIQSDELGEGMGGMALP
jgi:hypothetical protein